MKKFFWKPSVRLPIVLATWLLLALIAWPVMRFLAIVFLVDCGR